MAKNLLFKLSNELGQLIRYLLLFININRINKNIYIDVIIN